MLFFLVDYFPHFFCLLLSCLASSPTPFPPSSARRNAGLRGRGDLRRRHFCRRQHPRAQRRRASPPPLQRLRTRLHALDTLGIGSRAGSVGHGSGQRVSECVELLEEFFLALRFTGRIWSVAAVQRELVDSEEALLKPGLPEFWWKTFWV